MHEHPPHLIKLGVDVQAFQEWSCTLQRQMPYITLNTASVLLRSMEPEELFSSHACHLGAKVTDCVVKKLKSAGVIDPSRAQVRVIVIICITGSHLLQHEHLETSASPTKRGKRS